MRSVAEPLLRERIIALRGTGIVQGSHRWFSHAKCFFIEPTWVFVFDYEKSR